jgi:hypothetical protein
LDGYQYGLNLLGSRTNITRSMGLTTNIATVDYDPITQVTGWTGREANGTSRQNEQLGYGYDAANNKASGEARRRRCKKGVEASQRQPF